MQKAFVIGIIILFSSCGFFQDDDEGENPLAKVHDEELYASQLPADIMDKAYGPDSLSYIRLYVNNWVRKQVMLHNAQENLGEDIPDIERKVKDYRNSLLIYNYQRALFQRLLDTVVTQKEIRHYYDSNSNNFELKRNIVRMRYVKVSNEATDLNKAKRWFLSNNNEDHIKLLDYCAKNAANSYFDEDAWLSFDDLLKEIPLKNYSEETFLKTNKFVELRDEDYVYWIYIVGFRVKSNISPLELETENIRNIIINKRKLKLLESMEGSLLKEAEENNHVEWYID